MVTVLFGASNAGIASYFLLKDKKNIIYYCDNDKNKWGKEINGIKVIPPDELKNIKSKYEIIITSSYVEEIASQLSVLGIKDFTIFDFNLNNLTEKLEKMYLNVSYSQEGEDTILKQIFDNQESGIYIDVGAHHPVRFSNTYYFYRKGWRGINIEPSLGSKEIFDRIRPNDINLEVGISNTQGEIDYYVFNESAINTFDRYLAMERCKNSKYQLMKIMKIKVDTLKNILDKYLKSTSIDFLSIDVEGFEINVLQSNDWNRYRPKVILIESLKTDFENIKNDEIYKFLSEKNYELIAKTIRTCFYKHNGII